MKKIKSKRYYAFYPEFHYKMFYNIRLLIDCRNVRSVGVVHRDRPEVKSISTDLVCTYNKIIYIIILCILYYTARFILLFTDIRSFYDPWGREVRKKKYLYNNMNIYDVRSRKTYLIRA